MNEQKNEKGNNYKVNENVRVERRQKKKSNKIIKKNERINGRIDK